MASLRIACLQFCALQISIAAPVRNAMATGTELLQARLLWPSVPQFG